MDREPTQGRNLNRINQELRFHLEFVEYLHS